jgi:hypothetical protein
MPEKKEPKKKESFSGAKLRKALDDLRKYRAEEKKRMATKAQVKKPVPKKEESWVAKLKRKVQAYFKAEQEKKKPLVTKRTRQVQRQMGDSAKHMKTDQERAEEKKKREQKK